MRNRIVVNCIVKEKNIIEYNYEVDGEWKQYFNNKEKFIIEYDQEIEEIPYGIAVIPFLCNVLPIAWIFDGEIIIDEVDEDFYNSISNFKKGYIDMYPKIDFLGKLTVNNIVSYKVEDNKKSLALFSGGVDAFYTLLSHIKEKPCIATIWGSDIKLNDTEGWSKVIEHTKATAKLYNIDHTWIKSSFRMFINEGRLGQAVYSRANDGWWHGFQHGIGLIGHVAPYIYKNNISKVYIAASFTIQEKGKVTCASDPTIDDNVRFCGAKVKHDGYEASRQDKIKYICQYSKDNNIEIPLRVCWESTGGSNCCKCEKCYRSLFGILAEKEDPRKYGFNYSNKEFIYINKDLKNRVLLDMNDFISILWKDIQYRFRENYEIYELSNNLKWFYRFDISNIDVILRKFYFKIIRKLKIKIYNLIRVVKRNG